MKQPNGKKVEVCPTMFFSLSVKNFMKISMLRGKWVHLGSGFQTVSLDSLRFSHTLPPKFVSLSDDENVIVNATNISVKIKMDGQSIKEKNSAI